MDVNQRTKRTQAKLTIADVKKIKTMLNSDDRPTMKEIGAQFGVSKLAISKINTGETWASVNPN